MGTNTYHLHRPKNTHGWLSPFHSFLLPSPFLSLSLSFPFLFPFPFPLRSLSTPFLCLSAPFPSLISYVSAPNSLTHSNSGSVLHGFTKSLQPRNWSFGCSFKEWCILEGGWHHRALASMLDVALFDKDVARLMNFQLQFCDWKCSVARGQVYGRKRLRLFSPLDTKHLKANEQPHCCWYLSRGPGWGPKMMIVFIWNWILKSNLYSSLRTKGKHRGSVDNT